MDTMNEMIIKKKWLKGYETRLSIARIKYKNPTIPLRSKEWLVIRELYKEINYCRMNL